MDLLVHVFHLFCFVIPERFELSTLALEFYISGCELRLRLESRLSNFNKFQKETGISLGNLLVNKHNVAKQLHVLKMALEKLGVKGLEEDQYAMLNN